MIKEQFTEYNGIAVGDTIRITKSLGQCYVGYRDWLFAFNFDATRWRKYYNPDCNTLCTVLGIAKHLNYGNGCSEDNDILFYVDDGKYTWIMSIQGITLYSKAKKKGENRNSYITQGKTKIFTIID